MQQHRMIPLLLTGAACCALALTLPHQSAAQSRIDVMVRGSMLPLYGGDATVAAYNRWAGTAQVGVLLGTTGGGELHAFYTVAPRSDDPHAPAPRVQMAGILAGLSRGVTSRFTGVGSVGAGIIDVAPRPVVCAPPLCMAEGGGSFSSARLPTVVGALGLDAALPGSLPLRLRLDARGHVPLGADADHGDSGDRRLDLGVGLRYVF